MCSVPGFDASGRVDDLAAELGRGMTSIAIGSEEGFAQADKAINTAAGNKEILERFAALGFETEPGTPEALARRSKAETEKWAKAIRDAKIEPQ